MFSSLHRRDYCWKWIWSSCPNIIEYTLSPWWRTIRLLKKSTCQNTQVEQNEGFSSILFDRNRNIKCHIQYEESWFRWITSKLRRNKWITSKLCWHTFKNPSEEVIMIRSEKMKPKYMKDVWKSFFLINL